MVKFRFYYDKDKEEDFLNYMASRGYAMRKFFAGIYWFERCIPGEYTYRVDLIRDKSIEQQNEFYALVRDTGGEFVQKWGVWAFFRKKGDFELYTDNESKIDQYRRIKRIFMILGVTEFCILPSQVNLYLSSQQPGAVILPILVGGVGTAFFYQVYKCSRKIEFLKETSKF